MIIDIYLSASENVCTKNLNLINNKHIAYSFNFASIGTVQRSLKSLEVGSLFLYNPVHLIQILYLLLHFDLFRAKIICDKLNAGNRFIFTDNFSNTFKGYKNSFFFPHENTFLLILVVQELKELLLISYKILKYSKFGFLKYEYRLSFHDEFQRGVQVTSNTMYVI